MNNEMKGMFNSILDEMAKMEKRMEKKMDSRFDAMDRRFERLENQMELLWHEVNACKLERESVGMLTRLCDRLEWRLDEHDVRIGRSEHMEKKNLSMV